MPHEQPASYLRRAGLILLPLGALALPGCGADGFSRDSVVESSGAEAFLDRIQTNCSKLSVGNQQLGWLLQPGSNDVGFVDAASKYYLGQFDGKQFRDYINSFYPTGTNQPALDCIDSQLQALAKP
jgi:hypothetical protein